MPWLTGSLIGETTTQAHTIHFQLDIWGSAVCHTIFNTELTACFDRIARTGLQEFIRNSFWTQETQIISLDWNYMNILITASKQSYKVNSMRKCLRIMKNACSREIGLILTNRLLYFLHGRIKILIASSFFQLLLSLKWFSCDKDYIGVI